MCALTSLCTVIPTKLHYTKVFFESHTETDTQFPNVAGSFSRVPSPRPHSHPKCEAQVEPRHGVLRRISKGAHHLIREHTFHNEPTFSLKEPFVLLSYTFHNEPTFFLKEAFLLLSL